MIDDVGCSRRHQCPQCDFECILLNENIWIPIKISPKFVPKGPFTLALVEIMAWRCPGDKPSFQPRMVSLPTHVCVTQPHRVKQGLVQCTLFEQKCSLCELPCRLEIDFPPCCICARLDNFITRCLDLFIKLVCIVLCIIVDRCGRCKGQRFAVDLYVHQTIC